ncbi:3-oxoacyl-ACP synthase [Streptomyces sp. CHD11]|uniref:3-oxoacyl-ACP synthase III family protein n=1 Tax=Streptomyces sp. CHD11 TaxID=2741325 RepID=UPI001BFC6D5F|nr:3-oxoacyl-[acyl-carrier-protein] synthase III C-terminal domain-containing protein [Streptomyces sp. CHD11]MBT3153719.1 3-oxoacyl-ACP synthase [Streptomyces sp. CHD11]
MSEALRARIAAVSAHLPSRYRTLDEIRVKITETGGYAPPPGLLEDLTGVRGVHVHDDGENSSDLAVKAARGALDQAGLKIADVGLLLFASTSQDLVEPATSHLVAAKLGASCPVFDIKNACNSFLNAMEVASSFIETGRYRTVLITCGEPSTLATRWHAPDREDLLRALPGYTASDAGAAMVLTAGPARDGDPGILSLRFVSNSAAWEACTVAGGGSMHHLSVHDDHTTLRLNGDLRQGLIDVLPRILDTAGDDLEAARSAAFVAFHQIAMPQYREMIEGFSLPEDRCLPAVAEHGNCAAASLPLQLVKARQADRIESGDLVAMIGLASGFSFGLALVRW